VLVLGIETSCDETAVGIVEDRFTLRANVIASQVELHAPYGGVVPEVAARAHLEALLPTVDQALVEAGIGLSDVDAIAVTVGPRPDRGAARRRVRREGAGAGARPAPARRQPPPGHVEAAQLEHGELEPPLAALVVSGGHTSIVAMDADGVFRQLGSTIDDAAGEAFDKIARFIGLGYPGGPEIDRLARAGDPKAIDFPRAMMHEDSYDMSLSGLKTAVIRYLRKLEAAGDEPDLADVAASFQEAIVDVQVVKTLKAAAAEGLEQVVLAGGVAANTRLRARFQQACEEEGLRLLVPSIPLCTDNGAMVAASGANLLAAGRTEDLRLGVDPTCRSPDEAAAAVAPRDDR
jgi:N6-L-threonylcarbamoyladenine synthase